MNNDTTHDAGRARELMKKIGFAMLVTRDGGKLRARPMSAFVERDENAIYFLTDARRHKDEEIARDPSINLSFADAGSQKYVSVTGTAAVANDRAKIKQLFSTPAKAWWESADDSNIRVLKIMPEDAEFWGSPGSVISYVKMAAAAVTGSRPDRRQSQGRDVDADRAARNSARHAGPADRAPAGRSAAAREPASGLSAAKAAASEAASA